MASSKKVPNPKGNPEFKPKWKTLPTSVERFPVEFLPLLRDLARKLDSGSLDPKQIEALLIDRDTVLSEVAEVICCQPQPEQTPSSVVLDAIDLFIDRQRQAYGKNSAQKGEFSTNASTYRHLLNFRSAVENGDLI